MRKDFLIFGSPLIEQDEINEVLDCLKSGWISTGPRVDRFEKMFRSYIGCKHALAINSCTAGLHLSLSVSGIKRGDEVITTPMTFAATANVIEHVGAKPVFVDIDLPSMNIDVKGIEEKITSRTKAIIPVHFAGRACQMDDLMDISHRYKLMVVEDAAHSVEATYKGEKIGTIGDFTVFSFYVTKNLITGEGGMVTTENDEWAEQIQIYALHGMSKGAWKRYSDEGYKHYQIVFPGYKYNMMDLQAAIGIHQLRKLESNLKRREEIWSRYDEAFEGLPLELPPPPDNGCRHARHLYTILLRLEDLKMNRDDFVRSLYDQKIGTGVHFLSLHLHPYYSKKYRYKPEDFPNAAYVSERIVSLPLSPKLNCGDVEDVISAVKTTLNHYSG
jgi:dTDP-4-amino-4,6-dideoxygalactose transaminase